MKKFILTLVLSAALSTLAIAAPAIYVAEPIYNFGSVSDGFAVIHTFVIENRGDQELTILRISRQCGCTTTGLQTPYTIAPGDSVGLAAQVNTASFGGREISKGISVYSNDPVTPKLSLEIVGQVIAASELEISAVEANYNLYALVDLRPAEAYQTHHLFGAVNVAVEDLVKAVSDLPHDTIIILVDTAFEASEAAALALRQEGFNFAYALVGGLNEWLHEYGMKYVTNASTDYELPPRVAYSYETRLDWPFKSTHELDSQFCVFVDLRSTDEYRVEHILGAINVPFGELDSQTDALPASAMLICYDQDGSNSDSAVQWMVNHGFGLAQGLVGGLDEWIRQYQRAYLLSDPLTQIDDQDGTP